MTSIDRTVLLERFYRETGFKYPVRWADGETTLGDFEGRGATIEVFRVPAVDQLSFYRGSREQRVQLETALGNRVTLVFHTPEETERHYSRLFAELSGAELQGYLRIVIAPGGIVEEQSVVGELHFPYQRAA